MRDPLWCSWCVRLPLCCCGVFYSSWQLLNPWLVRNIFYSEEIFGPWHWTSAHLVWLSIVSSDTTGIVRPECIHFLLFLNTSQSFPILLSTGTVLGSSQELSWRLVTLNTKISKRYDDVNGHDLSRVRKLDFFFKINLLWDQGRESSVIIVIQTVQRSLELWCVMMIICKLNCFHSEINSWCYAPLKSKHQHPPPPGKPRALDYSLCPGSGEFDL